MMVMKEIVMVDMDINENNYWKDLSFEGILI